MTFKLYNFPFKLLLTICHLLVGFSLSKRIWTLLNYWLRHCSQIRSVTFLYLLACIPKSYKVLKIAPHAWEIPTLPQNKSKWGEWLRKGCISRESCNLIGASNKENDKSRENRTSFPRREWIRERQWQVKNKVTTLRRLIPYCIKIRMQGLLLAQPLSPCRYRQAT